MDQTPFVWPAINIPVPFGATPVHDELQAAGRILRAMPFGFYYAPYLVTTLKHYDPVAYYQHLIGLLEHAASPVMLHRRIRATPHPTVRTVHRTRTAGTRASLRRYRLILHMLRTDSRFRAFHEGRTARLPEFYQHQYERMLGPYSGLLTRADRTPDLNRIP